MPAVASSVSSVVSSATASAGLGSWLKKAALRAAGEEGLAENVRNKRGETFGIDAIHAARVEEAQKEIRYKTQYQPVHCLDTPGQVFAILLNALYLAPLTYVSITWFHKSFSYANYIGSWLFINFFVQSYIKRVRSATPPPDRTQIAKESSKDAAHNLEKEIEDAMAEQQEGNQADLPPAVQENLERAKANLKNKADDLSSKTRKTAQDANDAISRTAHTAKTEAEKKAKNAKEAVTNQMESAKEGYDKMSKEGKEVLEKRTKEAKEALEKRTREAKEAYEKRIKEAKEALEKRTNDSKEAVAKRTKEALEALEQMTRDAKEALEQRATDVKEAGANITDSGIAGASEVARDSVKQAEKAVDNLTQDDRDESEEGDQDSMAVQVEDSDDHNDSQDIVKIDSPGSEQGTGPEPELEDAQPGNGEDNDEAQPDTKVEGEVEKADEEWDPEDGRDPEAEAYEVQIDQMLNASEKRAEQELLPDLS
jgi:hypothetical protein